ncbi:aminoglycoside phosphotransferase family protein [Kitasatospora cystarginea]|uniref:Aminoglycoside phosphotransferase family protein n=1 Tax=Kitasatospora cystarginea TaxID=58350 RepID=A0ABN3EDE6_9ACTN
MTTTTPAGGFAALELTEILRRACEAVGEDPTGAILLRGHTNAVVRLATAPVVVKIARRGTRLADVQRTVRLVEWLQSMDFPTAPLHPVRQPLDPDGHPVTFWTYLTQSQHPVAAELLADPLRRLHALPEPPVRLPAVDTVGAIRRSLAAIAVLPDDEHTFLSTLVDGLERDLASVRYELRPGVIQGDPQHRNALHFEGRAVLCDWDTASLGQPEWDLVTMEIHCRRFGYGQDHYKAFATAYGFDVTAWEGYRTLSALRELRMITTNAKKAPPHSAALAEVRNRIDGLRQADSTLAWNIL